MVLSSNKKMTIRKTGMQENNLMVVKHLFIDKVRGKALKGYLVVLVMAIEKCTRW